MHRKDMPARQPLEMPGRYGFHSTRPAPWEENWFRKSAQDDEWNFCLTTAMIAVNRRDHEQTTPPEPLAGLQGEGGPGRHQGRPNDRPAGRAFRRPPQPDHGMEIAA